MGGDNAPAAILQGCWDAAALLGIEDSILLVGDEAVSRAALDASPLSPEQKRRYRIVHTTQVVHMDDAPVEAIRGKPDSSLSVMCKLAAKGEADVVISAGNTGACVAAAQLRMRLLPGVVRPGIAVIIPTFHGPVVICDVGANVTPQPRHLQQYAIMAAAYAQAVVGIDNPRIGLLSIGEEDAKGTTIVKESRKLMRDEPLINFVGNVEGRDLFKGVVDVVVCDGFVGNIVLKFTEGMAEGLFQMIGAELQQESPGLLEQFKPVLKRLHTRHDWQEYGGAPLLGVAGYCLICHGRSDAKAIRNAIRVGKQLCASRINDKIVETIRQSIPGSDEVKAQN
jgi:glycerol-3-phosphate acyltransferase PlsX